MFLRVQRNLNDATINKHIAYSETFYKSELSVQEFLHKIKQTKSLSTYAYYLKTLNILFRDFLKQPELIQDFRFPKKQYKPKILPNKEQLGIFYSALPDKYKPIFLALASSGLRINELLNSRIEGNMLIPPQHNGSTKGAWISFINDETMSLVLPKVQACIVARTFRKAAKKTGIHIYPHLLRSVFAQKMAMSGIPDRYIDAFCGRIPQSILARNYTDYSPEVLKEIYSKANIKILE